MDTPDEIAAFDRGVHQLMQIVLSEKAEAVISFRANPELQERSDELAERAAEGQPTEAEQSEYAGCVRANKFVAILQQHARGFAES